jgi:hypothetical protein
LLILGIETGALSMLGNFSTTWATPPTFLTSFSLTIYLHWLFPFWHSECCSWIITWGRALRTWHTLIYSHISAHNTLTWFKPTMYHQCDSEERILNDYQKSSSPHQYLLLVQNWQLLRSCYTEDCYVDLWALIPKSNMQVFSHSVSSTWVIGIIGRN